MSDVKLRELERSWRETGAVEDEAAYLLERVRVGDLTRERLEVAVHLGHLAAVRAFEHPQPCPPDLDSIGSALRRASESGPRLLVELVAALLVPLRSAWSTEAAGSRLPLDILDRWLRTTEVDDTAMQSLATETARASEALAGGEAAPPGLSMPEGGPPQRLPWPAAFALAVSWLGRLATAPTPIRGAFLGRKAVMTAVSAREVQSGTPMSATDVAAELGRACLSADHGWARQGVVASPGGST